MFRYGLRAHDLGLFAPSAIAAAVRGAGFDAIQLAPRKLVRDFPEVPTIADARALGSALREGGIRVDVLGCYIDPAHPDESARAAAVARFASDIRLCREYGASIIATETGRPWNPPSDDANAARAGTPTSGARREFDILVQNFRALAAIAREEGVTIAVEPVWQHILSTPNLAAKLVDAVDDPSLGLLLDPCNLVAPSHCEECHGSLTPEGKLKGIAAPALEALSLLGGRLVAIHAKDFYYRGGEKTGATCGEGAMDWKTVAAALRARVGGTGRNRSIPVIIEEHDPGCHASARAFLSGLLT